MAKKDALRLRYTAKFSSAGLGTLYSDRVEQGEFWCIERVTWEIDTATSGGNTRCRRFIDGHGYKHYLAEQDAPAAGALYWDKRPIYLYPGERMALELDEAQADTNAEMQLTGYREQIP